MTDKIDKDVLSAAAYEIGLQVMSGATAQELRAYISKVYGDKILFYLNSLPRKNIRKFIRTAVETYGIEFPVLDAGCGYRSNLAEVALGLSLDAESIRSRYFGFDHVKHKQETVGSNLSLIGKMDKIPFANNCAGTILCTEVLEHVRDDKASLVEIHRVLKQGRLLILSVPGKGIPKHEKLPHQVDYRRYGVGDLDKMLRETGFEVLTYKSVYEFGFQTNIFFVCRKQ